jgi:Domain found in Dishevelled, Egl-10, and Pleckstrin (DEP)
MLHEIDVRNRMRHFKIHRGVFLGSVAVKWIMAELSYCNSQAVTLGNLMLNSGLFHHVGREHTFCDSKLYALPALS